MKREVKFRKTKKGIMVYGWCYGIFNQKIWTRVGRIEYLKDLFSYGYIPAWHTYSISREVLEKIADKIKELEKKHETTK